MKNSTIAGIVLILASVLSILGVFAGAYAHDYHGTISVEQYQALCIVVAVVLAGIGAICYGIAREEM